MRIAQLVAIAINVSLGLMVFTIGLRTRVAEIAQILRRPGLLLRSLTAMNVVMPVLATLVGGAFDLDPPVKVALVALALSPVPPILPILANKKRRAGEDVSYGVGLLVTAAAASILIVPAGIQLLASMYGISASVSPLRIAEIVGTGVLAPLLSGIAVRSFAPRFAERAARPLSLFGTGLLVGGLLTILIVQWSAIVDVVGNGALIALALFTIVGVTVGHLLGGPEHYDRIVLALATSSRHPGVALLIAKALFPEEKNFLPVLLWHLVFGGILAAPYLEWRSRVYAARSDPGASP